MIEFRGRRETQTGACSVCKVKKGDKLVPKVHRAGMCPYDRMPTSCGVNKKVGSDTVIFNINAASYCPSLASTRQKYFDRGEVESMSKVVKGRTACLPSWLNRTAERRRTGWNMWVVTRDVKTDDDVVVKNVTRYTSEKLALESEEARHPGAVVRRMSHVDMCEVGRENCYAVSTEKLRPNTLFFRIRQEFMWDALTSREIADDIELALDQYYKDAMANVSCDEYFTKKVKSITGHGTKWRDRFVTHPFLLIQKSPMDRRPTPDAPNLAVDDGTEDVVADNPKKGWDSVEVRFDGDQFTYKVPSIGKTFTSKENKFPPEVANLVLHKDKKGNRVVSCVRTNPNVKPRFIRFSESGDARDQADVDKLAEVFRIIQEERPDIRIYGYTARRDLDWSKMPENTVVNGSGCLRDFQNVGVHNSFIATFVRRDKALYCVEDCRFCGISPTIGGAPYQKWFAKHGSALRVGSRFMNKYCAVPHGREVFIHFHGGGSKSKVHDSADA